MATLDPLAPSSSEISPGIEPASLETYAPLEQFGTNLSDSQYYGDIERYIGQKLVVTSCGVRHFRANGFTIKFANDPVSMEQELSTLLAITSLPMDREGKKALLMPWNHPRLGLIDTFVPLERAVTTIFLPPDQQ